MIKKLVFIVFSCFVLGIMSANACDVCGAGANNMGIGLLTNFRSNFIRMGYFQSSFTSNFEHDYSVKDRFEQIDLTIRYSLGKNNRWKAMASLPFGKNSRTTHDENQIERGMADCRFNVNYVLLNNLKVGENAMLYVEAGTGLSIPTGKFDSSIHDRNLPENFNIGRGALGYIFQLNSVLSNGKNGVVLSANYQINSATETGYRYGNQLTSQLTLFRELPLKQLKLIPNLGLNFEKITKDKYTNNNTVPGTGGNGLFLSSSVNIKTEKWLTGFSYAIPLADKYSDSEVKAKGRIVCHVSYLF